MSLSMVNLDTGLNKAIRYHRRSMNMPQAELARLLDVRTATVSYWEHGKSKPTIDDLIKLAKIFGVSEQELLHPTEIKETEYVSRWRRTKKEESNS